MKPDRFVGRVNHKGAPWGGTRRILLTAGGALATCNFQLSQLQNDGFAIQTEFAGCAGIKPDAALARTAKWRAQTKR